MKHKKPFIDSPFFFFLRCYNMRLSVYYEEKNNNSDDDKDVTYTYDYYARVFPENYREQE